MSNNTDKPFQEDSAPPGLEWSSDSSSDDSYECEEPQQSENVHERGGKQTRQQHENAHSSLLAQRRYARNQIDMTSEEEDQTPRMSGDANALLRSVAAVHLPGRSLRYDADYGEARTSISSPGRRLTLRERLRARARLQKRIQEARDHGLMEALEEHENEEDDFDEEIARHSQGTVRFTAETVTSRVKIEPTVAMQRYKAQPEPCTKLVGVEKPQTNRILLHVYDLIEKDTLMMLPPFGCVVEIGKCFADMNTALHAVGTGAYHVGVEINGVEYAYGATSIPNQTGVFTCFPRLSPGYQYRTTIDLGERPLIRRSWVSVPNDADPSKPMTVYREVEEFIQGRSVMKEMALEYMGSDYDILRKNCCTFDRDACLRLGVPDEEIPSWFRNLAESGAMTQDLARATVEPLTSVLSLACEDGMKTSPAHARRALIEATVTDQGIETIFQTADQSSVLVVDDFNRREIRRNSTWHY